MLTLNGTEVTPTIFPDGTSQVWKLGDLVRPDRNSVRWDFENEAELFHLFQLSMLLQNTGSRYDSLHIPYLPYARQDKETSDSTTFSLRTFARIINQMNWYSVSAFDVHSREATRLIDQLVNIPPDLSFVKDYDFVIFPDAGACSRYEALVLGFLELDKSRIIVGEKTRDQETGYITSYNIDVDRISGKRVIVADDLLDGGRTFEILGEELYTAEVVDLYVSHGLFSKSIDKLLCIYDKIITTDSCGSAQKIKDQLPDYPIDWHNALVIKPHLKAHKE